jgi:hypothetical protein
MWLPAPLYETLPYLYLTVGATAVLMTKDPLGWFCGSVLIFTGIAIRRTRRLRRQPIVGSRLE